MTGNIQEKKLGIERLEQLATHLESGRLGHQRFAFNYFHYGPDPRITHCGTGGCALGECPFVFPDDWDFETDGRSFLPALKGQETFKQFLYDEIIISAQKFFSLDRQEVGYLFTPYPLPANATAQQVAENIRMFVAKARLKLDNSAIPGTCDVT